MAAGSPPEVSARGLAGTGMPCPGMWHTDDGGRRYARGYRMSAVGRVPCGGSLVCSP